MAGLIKNTVLVLLWLCLPALCRAATLCEGLPLQPVDALAQLPAGVLELLGPGVAEPRVGYEPLLNMSPPPQPWRSFVLGAANARCVLVALKTGVTPPLLLAFAQRAGRWHVTARGIVPLKPNSVEELLAQYATLPPLCGGKPLRQLGTLEQLPVAVNDLLGRRLQGEVKILDRSENGRYGPGTPPRRFVLAGGNAACVVVAVESLGEPRWTETSLFKMQGGRWQPDSVGASRAPPATVDALLVSLRAPLPECAGGALLPLYSLTLLPADVQRLLSQADPVHPQIADRGGLMNSGDVVFSSWPFHRFTLAGLNSHCALVAVERYDGVPADIYTGADIYAFRLSDKGWQQQDRGFLRALPATVWDLADNLEH